MLREQDQFGTMEVRLTEMGDTTKKWMAKVRGLWQENAALRRVNEEVARGIEPNHNEHAKSWLSPEVDTTEEERRQMHYELWELGDK